MTTLLLSAGEATRLGDLAPHGCKALTSVGGRTMLDWWQDLDPGLTVVCRSEHRQGLLGAARDLCVCDEGGGPAVALRTALSDCDGPVTVIFADTWVPADCVPSGVDWCGVAAASGGRAWDVLEDGLYAYRHVDPGEVALVAIGLYRFSDIEALTDAVNLTVGTGQTGMADVVNHYGLCTPKPVRGWQDVGDPAALDAWSLA